MTAYFVGDIPAEDLVIEPARGGLAIGLESFDSVSVTLRGPDGLVIESSGFLASIVTDTVVVEWPGETILETPGVYTLSLVLEGVDAEERLAPVRIVCQAVDDGWYTLDSLREDWDAAPDEDLITWDLLYLARRAVEAYAPAGDLPDDGRPPYHWRRGQLMHCRTLFRADNGDPIDASVGLGGFVVTPKSLEKNTREVLRPKTAVPVFG